VNDHHHRDRRISIGCWCVSMSASPAPLETAEELCAYSTECSTSVGERDRRRESEKERR
jgi:hypothetical protein